MCPDRARAANQQHNSLALPARAALTAAIEAGQTRLQEGTMAGGAAAAAFPL